MPTGVLRIAHGFGDRRSTIETALAAGVDYLEADIRFDGGRLWVRHEHRLPGIPVLFNHRLAPRHRHGPWATTVGPYFFRLDLHRFPFDELLHRVAGRAGLLLDLKAAHIDQATADRFAREVVGSLPSRPDRQVMFCGNWRVLSALSRIAPSLPRFYSVDTDRHWAIMEPHVEAGRVRGLSLRRSLVTPARGERLRALGVEFLAWDISTIVDARAAVDCGAAGVLSSSLEALRAMTPLPETAR